MTPRPPALATALYGFFLDPDDESELGDLLEEYAEIVVPERGARRARIWFWGQVLRSIAPSLVTPVLREGVRRVALGLCVGTVVFYGLGVGAAFLMNGFGAGVTDAAYPVRFALYLFLSGIAAFLAGGFGAAISRAAGAFTATALVATALGPQIVSVVLGVSTEPALAQVLWAAAIPLGIFSGSRSRVLRRRPRHTL